MEDQRSSMITLDDLYDLILWSQTMRVLLDQTVVSKMSVHHNNKVLFVKTYDLLVR